MTQKTPMQDYTHIADSYDEDRFQGIRGEFNYAIDREIVSEYAEIAAPNKLLDVPTGTGRVLDYLGDMPVEIIGCDATQGMLDRASRHVVDGKHTLLLGDASDLPFDDNEFDCIVSLRFFHLFDKQTRRKFTAEFDRVLKPGGYVICSFTNGWYAGGINWIKRVLGFRTVFFQYPGELKGLFPNYRVCKLRGNFLPLQSRLNRSLFLGRFLRGLTRSFPFNLVCWERVYLLRKNQ